MQILSDGEWARLKAARSGTGRPLDDERQRVEAIVWRQRNGAKGRAVPADLGRWWQAAQLHIRWSRAGGVGARLCGAARGRATRAWRSLSRRDEDACPPQGGGRNRGASAQALGRSRAGDGTKACAVCEARARPLGFALIPGRALELQAAPELRLLAALLGTIRRVIGDAAYSSAAWFALVMEAGAVPVVRANPTHPQPNHFDRAACRRRHKVENMGPR